jgi:hypothetical protein
MVGNLRTNRPLRVPIPDVELRFNELFPKIYVIDTAMAHDDHVVLISLF